MDFVQQLLLLAPLALGEFDPAHATPPDAASHESTQGSDIHVSGEIGVEEAEAMNRPPQTIRRRSSLRPRDRHADSQS